MNLLIFVFFFLLLVSVFSVGKPEILSTDIDGNILSPVIETYIRVEDTNTDIQSALTLADIRACEKNILIYRIDTRGQAPPGCTVSSQDPIYLKKLANYLAITLRLHERVFCKRSFDFGDTKVTNLQAHVSIVSIFSSSIEKRCPPDMEFVL
jgi:hypothetical protein